MTQSLAPVLHRLHYISAHLREKARGVDFTLPDRMYDRRRNDGAMYYATSPALLEQLFGFIDQRKYDSFLDVGCGKGYVLSEAARRGFRRVGGVEYDEKLADICARNLRRVGLGGRVALYQMDAASFRGYGDYNCFYFFNPFMPSVMADVIDAIRRQCRGMDVTLLYYHPRYTQPIETAGCFRKVNVLYDPTRNYELYIYEGTVF